MIISKFWREILIAILAIALFSSIRSCNKNSDNTSIAIHRGDSAFLVAHYYKNKQGELIAQVNTSELTAKQYKQFSKQLGFENQDLKMQNKKLKGLVAHWQGQASIHDTVFSVGKDTTLYTNKKDTVGTKAIYFAFTSKYLTLDQFYTPLDRKLETHYSYTVDFSLTAYRKQQGLFKKQGQLVADVYFSDPAIKVSTFKGFVIKEPPRRWYQTTGFKIALGAAGGIVGYRYLTK